MANGTILFIHGTGVRGPGYQPAFRDASERAKQAEIDAAFEPCPWGDIFGARFSPQSLPADEYTPEIESETAKDLAHWSFLFDDPTFELRTLTIRGAQPASSFAGLGGKPKWLQTWDKIKAYQPSLELSSMLDREQLTPHWKPAFDEITAAPVASEAFRVTGDQTAESADALARAIVARMTVLAEDDGKLGPGRQGRQALVDRMKQDWGLQVYGIATFFADIFAKPATYVLKRRRSQWSQAIANPIGDILLYQSRGQKIRDYLKSKISSASRPVTLLAHSLGGIASVDVLASGAADADRLITFGSQAPFLYELGALESLKPPDPLPNHFPPWLNLYDENDFLSYLAEPVFGSARAKDVRIQTGRPFPASHSAYLNSPAAWSEIRSWLP